jgi:hypothetical protein
MEFAIVRKFTGLGKICRFSFVVPVSGGTPETTRETQVLPYGLQPLQQAGTRFESPASFYWNFNVKHA